MAGEPIPFIERRAEREMESLGARFVERRAWRSEMRAWRREMRIWRREMRITWRSESVSGGRLDARARVPLRGALDRLDQGRPRQSQEGRLGSHLDALPYSGSPLTHKPFLLVHCGARCWPLRWDGMSNVSANVERNVQAKSGRCAHDAIER